MMYTYCVPCYNIETETIICQIYGYDAVRTLYTKYSCTLRYIIHYVHIYTCVCIIGYVRIYVGLFKKT